MPRTLAHPPSVLDALSQLRPAARGDGPRGPALVERDASRGGEVEQLLALLALARAAQEEPAEEADGEDRALDHHDPAGDDLVGLRRDVVRPLTGPVDVEVRAVGPDEDVREHRRREAHRD